MEPRRIADLLQLKDAEFFGEIGTGLGLIHENATRLWESVPYLIEGKHVRVAEIQRVIALEEAAKYLILLDAVRCPRKPPERHVRQLRKFTRHLARGVYADICEWRPVDLKEVREEVERACQQYHLDGPNGYDWIFRNEIERQREESLYVDYVASDAGHYWTSPQVYENAAAAIFMRAEPEALRLVRAFHGCGFGTPEALTIIAKLWRQRTFADSTHYSENQDAIVDTLRRLDEAEVLRGVEDQHRLIVRRWPFPLYDLPMERIDVEKQSLREIQDRSHPDLWRELET